MGGCYSWIKNESWKNFVEKRASFENNIEMPLE